MLGRVQPTNPGRVTTVLPETHGVVRYRVQFPHESFERSISHDDIDAAESRVRTRDAKSASARDAKSGWVNPSAIKIRK
ncbi:hypothetical protein M8R20_15000 [Pseudomonas sp. R2.Fl]|nr:hypothetical protein [Pseudomonas sp. R2.Fl]